METNKYPLPPYADYKYSSLQNVLLLNCNNLIFDYHLCLQRLEISEHMCLAKQFEMRIRHQVLLHNAVSSEFRLLMATQRCEFRLLMATTDNCAILAQGV